jgi:hypothetical protein
MSLLEVVDNTNSGDAASGGRGVTVAGFWQSLYSRSGEGGEPGTGPAHLRHIRGWEALRAGGELIKLGQSRLQDALGAAFSGVADCPASLSHRSGGCSDSIAWTLDSARKNSSNRPPPAPRQALVPHRCANGETAPSRLG